MVYAGISKAPLPSVRYEQFKALDLSEKGGHDRTGARLRPSDVRHVDPQHPAPNMSGSATTASQNRWLCRKPSLEKVRRFMEELAKSGIVIEGKDPPAG